MYYNKECAYLTMLTMLLGVIGWEIFSRIWGPGYFAMDLNIILVGAIIAIGDVLLRLSYSKSLSAQSAGTAEEKTDQAETSSKTADKDKGGAVSISPLTLFLDSTRGAAYGWFPGWAVGAAIIIGCVLKMK